MSEQQEIYWITEQVRLGSLVEWEHNPVQLSKHDAEQIEISLKKFGLVLPLVANAAAGGGLRRLIDGHQRKTILIYSRMADADTVLDVRVPSRELTERECDELSIRLRRNTGEFDWDILSGFDAPELISWGFKREDFAAKGIFLDEDGKPVEGPEFKEYDESVENEVEWIECPECGHKWPK